MRTILATLLAVLHLAAAQDLAFVTPNITALQVDSRGWHYYMQGHDVEISWTTSFDKTTLILFEAQENGTWTYDVLGGESCIQALMCLMNHADTDETTVDYSSSKTSFKWPAQPIENAGLGNKMYFSIQKANDISCAGCVVKSPVFYVTGVRPAGGSVSSSMSTATSTSAPSGPSRTAGGASQTTGNSQSSQAAEAAAAANQHTSSKSSHSNAIGLGVGLGVGLAVLLALLALLFICLRRRRKNRHSFSYRPTGSGNWTQDSTPPNAEMREANEPKSMGDINRQSGIVGATAVAELASQSRQSDVSHVSNPFRPSTAASRMSHASWIEPFEFERPGAKEADAMSQLRQSTQADSPVQTDSTVHADSASSHYTDGPDVFGPESPSDAAAVASPSSYNGGMSRQSVDMPYRPSDGADPSGLAGIPERPQPAMVADGRNWPLP